MYIIMYGYNVETTAIAVQRVLSYSLIMGVIRMKLCVMMAKTERHPVIKYKTPSFYMYA